jgi:hypothetical protein
MQYAKYAICNTLHESLAIFECDGGEFDDFVAGAHGHDRRVETIVDGVVVGCV